MLCRIVFVCTAAFENKLKRDLAAKGVTNILSRGLLTFERLLYNVEPIRFGF